ncbi:MAG: hypothetical protein J1F36_00325 [Clostridiales bacterium]|nr:hypothetical protein [Clostridiales bacterium]
MNENNEVQGQEALDQTEQQGTALESNEPEQNDQTPEQEGGSEPTQQEPIGAQEQEEVPMADEPKKKLEKTGKKKRGACFTCCLSLLIFNFVCMCLLITVGWIAGDQLSRQKLGMPLSSTFGVVRGIQKSKSPKIERPYTADDEAGFYNSIGDALLLNEGVIDGEDLKETLSDSLKNEDNDLGEALGDYVVSVMKAENLNQSKIDAIGTDEQDTNLKISDRELAAFINGIVEVAVKVYAEDALKEANLDEMGVDLSKLTYENYVKVNQIKIYIDNNINKAKITTSVNIGKALEEFKLALDAEEFAESIASNISMESLTPYLKFAVKRALGLARVILPSKLYVTIDAGLSQSTTPTLQINNMSKVKMKNFYTMLANLNFDLKGEIDNAFVGEEGIVKTALDGINNEVSLSEVFADGGIDCDVFKLVIGIGKLNFNEVDGVYKLKPKDEQITSQDFLDTLQLILRDTTPLSDPDSVYYFYRDSNKSAVAAYHNANDEALLDRLGDNYALNTKEYSLAELLHVLNMIELKNPGRVDGLKIYDIIDPAKIEELSSITAYNWQEMLETFIDNVTYVEDSDGTDMFTSLIKEIVFEGNKVDISKLKNFDKDDLLFVKLENDVDKQYLSIVLKVVMRDLLPDAEGNFGVGLISGLISSSPSLITLHVDISDSEIYNKTEVIINNNVDGSDSMFRVLKSLGMDVSFEEIGDSIRNAFLSTKDRLDIKYGDNGLVLPNVFAMIDKKMLGSKYNDNGVNVHDAFNLIYKASDSKIVEFENSVAPNKIAQEKMGVDALLGAMLDDGISDQQFGAYISDIIGERAGRLLQFNILAANSEAEKQLADRRKFETLGFELDNSKAYITMTLNISVTKMGALPANVERLLPHNMFITFILEFNESESEFRYTDFVLNDSDMSSRDALIDLTGVGDAVQNLEGVADDCLAPVNDLLRDLMEKVSEKTGGLFQLQHSLIEDNDLDSTIRGHYKIEILK